MTGIKHIGNWSKVMFFFVLTSLFYTCIEPIPATVGNNSNALLVVDALISNENTSYQVRLSRSIANIDQDVIPETGAEVSIEDDQGIVVSFTETEDGIYKTNPSEFVGTPGRTYTLHIRTKDKNVYESDPSTMLSPSSIDNIYYVPGNHPDSVAEGSFTGLRMFIDGHAGNDDTEYLRWTYNEDWKFAIPFGSNLEIPTQDGRWEPIESKKYCWKSDVSHKINILAFGNQSEKIIKDKELFFIDSENSDKLVLRYSALVKQYSITKEEYEFWKKLEDSNTNVGNIFGEQPFTIRGNIRNIDNPDERVLGYFSVGGCASKRIYIDNAEIREYRLPIDDYYNSCSFDSLMFNALNMNAYEVYEEYVLNDFYNYEYAFAILPEGSMSTVPIGLAVSTPQCCDCSLQGDINAPDFWEE